MKKLTRIYQWYTNGDHPDDKCILYTDSDGTPFLGEGNIVRRYRHPEIKGSSHCSKCGNIMHLHGWIDQGEEGRTVCPGDYIVKINKQYYPVHPEE